MTCATVEREWDWSYAIAPSRASNFATFTSIAAYTRWLWLGWVTDAIPALNHFPSGTYHASIQSSEAANP